MTRARNESGRMAKADFCVQYGMSESQLERYFKQGMPHEKTGRKVFVPMPAGRNWYYEEIREQERRKLQPKTIDEARRRKESASAELEELKVAREKGRTMLVEDAVKEIASSYARVRAKLLNFAPRAAGAAFGSSSLQACRAKLEPLVIEILEELAHVDDDETQDE